MVKKLKQYFSKSKKRWVNFSDEDYLMEKKLIKGNYRIRTAKVKVF